MAVNTITVGPGTFTIGASSDLTTFTSQVTSIRLVPSVDQGDAIFVLSGESVAGDRTESYTIEGTLLQDFGSTGSRTEWLYNNAGETHVFTYTPATVSGKSITGSLVVEAVEIGGDVNTKPTSDFTFTCIGKPVIGTIV